MSDKVNVAEHLSSTEDNCDDLNKCKSAVTDARNLNYNGVQLIAFRQEVIILSNSTAKLHKNESDYF